MGKLEEKAYANGVRMAKYIVSRDGADMAMKRGSKANYVYVRKALSDSYDRGYNDTLQGLR